MRTIALFLIATIGLASCTPDFKVDNRLNDDEKREMQYAISRYVAKPAPKSTLENRFDPQFDDYYRGESKKIYPKFVHFDRKSKRTYFVVTHIAPSIHEKYVALGGYYISGENGFDEYEEVFRTWKFTEDKLLPKAEMLFRKMIKGADLSRFYPEVTGDQYIQFPNADTYFDKDQRRWVSTRENPLQEMKDEAARSLKEAGDAVRDARKETVLDSIPN